MFVGLLLFAEPSRQGALRRPVASSSYIRTLSSISLNQLRGHLVGSAPCAEHARWSWSSHVVQRHRALLK